ncbi:MAG TPA: MaoC family dehydratase [Ramlibacter sp.]|nr:MaoC family dehydratase [Ramlibacter sp.]
MPEQTYTFATLEAALERPFPPTDWVAVPQARIDAFADCTEDRQWIHVDRERAGREAPLGTTIAHGLLTLSLLPHFSYEAGLLPPGASHALNYGFDKVRFLAPVPAGARVRDVLALVAVQRKAPGQALVTVRHTVEIEGHAKPALVADAINLFIAAPGAAS